MPFTSPSLKPWANNSSVYTVKQTEAVGTQILFHANTPTNSNKMST